MKKIFFDIETVPTEDKKLIESFKSLIKPPANYSKPETIAKWLEENSETALREMVAKTSFDSIHGRIACIAWSIDGEEVQSSKKGQDEKEVIISFYDAIKNNLYDKHLTGKEYEIPAIFIGHNIVGFDIPFLKHRSMINQILPPKQVLTAFNAKAWSEHIQDTMLMWSTDREKRISMDKLCKAFGLEGKGDFDGSMVAETWKNDPQKVIDYCKDDVRRNISMYNRLSFSEGYQNQYTVEKGLTSNQKEDNKLYEEPEDEVMSFKM